MKLSDFEIKEFYNYKIRSVVENNIEMFFASDLIKQYNSVHNTNKKLKKYLETKQARDLLLELNKIKEAPKSGIFENSTNFWNIPGVIRMINIQDNNNDYVNSGYIMCEELLNSCLMWLDTSFAAKVLIFLHKCRTADSQFLNHPDEFIKSRIVPATECQDWSFMIIPCIRNSEIILKASYCRTKNITKTQLMNPNTIMLHGLPNGFSFKYFVYTELIQVVKSYSGHSNGCHRSSYSISKHVFENNFNIIIQGIVYAINKTRHMLNWCVDYESEVCTQVLNKLKSLEIPLCNNINMSKDSFELIQKLFGAELQN